MASGSYDAFKEREIGLEEAFFKERDQRRELIDERPVVELEREDRAAQRRAQPRHQPGDLVERDLRGEVDVE